jgi:hypothetical protein
VQAFLDGFVLEAFFEDVSVSDYGFKTKTSFSRCGGTGCRDGLMTGNRSGVFIVPLFVFNLPILPSKSFSLISKLKDQTYHTHFMCL